MTVDCSSRLELQIVEKIAKAIAKTNNHPDINGWAFVVKGNYSGEFSKTYSEYQAEQNP